MSRDLAPIRRVQFLAAIPADQRVVLIDRYEADYALTRLVHLNCGAVDEFEVEPTTFVLKGGFAIRHLYAGPRFSRDADVLPADPDLDLVGPSDLLIPRGMERGQPTVGDAIESWKVRIQYQMISRNRRGFISCDVNDLERLLRKRPPQRATFQSRFTAPFPVWAATVEEILAEKLVALMRRGADRIRDAFDVHHVLDQGGGHGGSSRGARPVCRLGQAAGRHDRPGPRSGQNPGNGRRFVVCGSLDIPTRRRARPRRPTVPTTGRGARRGD